MKIIKFLKTDIKIINSYLLFTIILIILVCIGYSSYALFSFTKTSTNIIEATVGELKKSGADTLIKLTDNKDNSGLYTITHPKDPTLQIGNDKDITEYRYRGANPKNYVTFNNEVWRIIGVFPTDDGTGKIENRIKIIKDQSIGNKFWDTGKSNNWARPATLNTELNTTYLNSLDSTSQSMIGNAKYYLGGYHSDPDLIDRIYQCERKIKNGYCSSYSAECYYYGTNPNSWVGKLGLMYASDYGYAASDECTQSLYFYNNATCKNNNWLFNSKDQWLMLQFSMGNDIIFNVAWTGGVSFNDDSDGTYAMVNVFKYAVRPVLYLIPSVQITGGDGTSSNPYIFGLK